MKTRDETNLETQKKRCFELEERLKTLRQYVSCSKENRDIFAGFLDGIMAIYSQRMENLDISEDDNSFKVKYGVAKEIVAEIKKVKIMLTNAINDVEEINKERNSLIETINVLQEKITATKKKEF